MPMSLALATGLGWLLVASPSKPSNERRFTPCAPDTPEWTQAGEALAALDARVRALPDDGDVRDAQAAMKALLDGRCFAMAREEWRWPEEEGVPTLALKAWWRDGGKAWLASYLELGRPGAHEVVLPPDVRPVLTRDSTPGHRLAELLCPVKDAACGAETEAWRERAERAFLPENSRHRSTRENAAKWRPDCVARAAKRPKRWRYTEWRSCLGDSQSRPRRKVLPLGRFRAPDGWLVIRGRRGHYEFCDEARAYHLGTGAAYVSRSCSGLALVEGGGVDVAGTDAARREGVRVGRMAPERLRELTWVLLLGPEVRDEVQVEAWRVPVPEGYQVERRERIVDDEGVEGFAGGSIWGHTAQTRLRWSWFPSGGAEPLSGELTYPDSADVAQDHADVLLHEVEGTFQEGCPPVPLPIEVLDFTRVPGVNGIDAPGGVAKVQDARVEALRAWRPPPGCGPGVDGG